MGAPHRLRNLKMRDAAMDVAGLGVAQCYLPTIANLCLPLTAVPPPVASPRRKTAEHVLGLLITVGQAIVYVLTGMYGEPAEVGAINGILIVLQVGAACWGS